MERVFKDSIEINIRETAKWISKSGELGWISGEQGKILSAETLRDWLQTSLMNVASFNSNMQVVGIATLSTHEADLPGNFAEICHCIVKPEYRRLYNGSSLILNLMRWAKNNGYSDVVGRVVVENTAGHELLRSLRWQPWAHGGHSYGSDLVWYKKNLSHEEQFWAARSSAKKSIGIDPF